MTDKVGPQPGAPTVPAERVPDSGLLERQAEDSPELAAFKAALEAPAPVFMRAGFSPGEQAALGFLAGLRGVGAVLPIIEQRRREAETVYEAARVARAERLGGLLQVAQIAKEERRTRATMAATAEERQFRRGVAIEQLRQGEERIGIQRAGLELRAGRMGGGRPLPAASATSLGENLAGAKFAKDALDRFEALGRPGGPFATLFTGAALTADQVTFRAELQKATANIRRAIFGSALSEQEKQSALALIPEFGTTRDSVIIEGLSQIRSMLLQSYESKVRSLGAAGYNVSGLEILGAQSGIVGFHGLSETQKREIQNLVDQGWSLYTHSPEGNPIYYRDGEYLEAAPDVP